jgi:hypothetical protein
MTRDQAQITFLQWLSVHDPKLYASVAAKHLRPVKLGSLGFLPMLINALIQVGSAVMQKKQADKTLDLQKKTLVAQDAQLEKDRAAQLQVSLLDINQKRAASGLGPVDLNGNPIQSQALPMPSSLAPLAQAAGMSFSNYTPWLIGASALAAVAGLFLVLRRR